MKSTGQTIGDMAAQFGLDTHVLRHWEDMGLLQPERDPAGRRRYSDADSVRIAVILCSKSSGMSLEQIAALLETAPADRNRILREHLDELDRRAAELQRAREMAEHALHCRARDLATCPRFRIHVSELSVGTPGDRARTARRRRTPVAA